MKLIFALPQRRRRRCFRGRPSIVKSRRRGFVLTLSVAAGSHADVVLVPIPCLSRSLSTVLLSFLSQSFLGNMKGESSLSQEHIVNGVSVQTTYRRSANSSPRLPCFFCCCTFSPLSCLQPMLGMKTYRLFCSAIASSFTRPPYSSPSMATG